MGSLTPSAVKTFREKGARFIHALTCEEDMGKRKVKNSLPPAALEKKAKSKRTLLNTAKDRPERRSFLYGPSVIIGSQKTQIYQWFAGSRQEVFILIHRQPRFDKCVCCKFAVEFYSGMGYTVSERS